MPKLIYFFVEHRDRELATVQALAKQCEASGQFQCKIFSLTFHLTEIAKSSTPALLVVPYCVSQAFWPLPFLRLLFGDVPVLNLCWEQYLSAMNKAYKAPRDRFCKEHLYYAAWNSSFKHYLEESGVDSKQIRIVGDPNVEQLYVSEKDSHSTQQRVFDRVPKGTKHITFFPTNYGWAHMSEREFQSRIQGGYDAEKAHIYRKFSQENLILFLKFLAQYASQTDTLCVLRPHPGVKVSQYLEKYQKHIGPLPSNLMVTRELTIKEWIHASELVISNWSTSAYHAFLLGKQAFLFQPVTIPECMQADFYGMMPRIKDSKSLQEALKNPTLWDQKASSTYTYDCAQWIIEAAQKETPYPNSVKNIASFHVKLLVWRHRIRAWLALLGIRHRQLRDDYFRFD
jgi:surface carbohydrate biosynthesis protein